MAAAPSPSGPARSTFLLDLLLRYASWLNQLRHRHARVILSSTFDLDAYITCAADGAAFIQPHLHPRNTELGNDHSGDRFRQRLDQLKLRLPNKRQQPFRDALVIDGVIDVIRRR